MPCSVKLYEVTYSNVFSIAFVFFLKSVHAHFHHQENTRRDMTCKPMLMVMDLPGAWYENERVALQLQNIATWSAHFESGGAYGDGLEARAHWAKVVHPGWACSQDRQAAAFFAVKKLDSFRMLRMHLMHLFRCLCCTVSCGGNSTPCTMLNRSVTQLHSSKFKFHGDQKGLGGFAVNTLFYSKWTSDHWAANVHTFCSFV